MLHVYHSNNMDLLKTLVVQIIKNDPLEGVFTEEKILVQSTGISQWLKMGIAAEMGIAANIKFPLPAVFLWEMFNIAIPNLKQSSALSKELIQWEIMAILPTAIQLPEFSHVKHYLDCDTTGIKKYQFAGKMADLYDQYSVYRPEWLTEWESGSWDKELVGDHSWQPILWKMLIEHTISKGESHHHRANMLSTFIATMSNPKFNKKKLPKRLFMVGISSLPPRFLDAIEALSKHIDIHLMFSNPCRYYWGDIKDRNTLAKLESNRRKKITEKSNENDDIELGVLKNGLDHSLLINNDDTLSNSVGNTLLASMGTTGRDYLSLLSEKETHEIDAFVDIERDSLLHCIQSDILNLEDKAEFDNLNTNEGKDLVDDDDRTITLHGCYSILREVEVLHDYLLKVLNDKQSTTPSDIIVMVSDIDCYSPHIHSVFGGAPHDRYIPFSVSDRTASVQTPTIQVFLDLLSINRNRQEASIIMTILESPPVMRKFKIDADGLDTLRTWIEDSGIRWGLDDKTAELHSLPTIKANNWLFGIKRMLMGYAIPESKGEFAYVLPYDESQGRVAELAGNLAMFIDELILLRDKLNSDHLIDDWISVINAVISDFFDIDKDEENAFSQIRDKTTSLYRHISTAQYNELISTDVILNHLENIFSKDRLSQHFMIGKVTFATLMPMRSIPFHAVCLLGMNDGVYPRSSPPEGFDLMAKNREVGDRSRRNDDRYLFLEAILSAQDSLYISHINKKIQDNTNKSPSVLVWELMEYIQKGYMLEDDLESTTEQAETNVVKNITFEHPLTPFSPASFKGEYQSFATEWISPSISTTTSNNVKTPFISAPLNIIDKSASVIELELSELMRFWDMPVKYFFNHTLKVNFDTKSGLSVDEETFSLTPLSSYPIKNSWLESLIDISNNQPLNQDDCDQVFNDTLNNFNLSGKLPHGGFAQACLSEMKTEIEELASTIVSLTSTPPTDINFDNSFEIDGLHIRVRGWSSKIFENSAIHYRVGKLRPQDIMRAWIQHLNLSITGDHYKTSIICLDQHVKFEPITKDLAEKHFKQLIKGYLKGINEPIAFFPRTAKQGLDSGYQKKAGGFTQSITSDSHSILSKMETAFSGGVELNGESSNPYISRVWPVFTPELASEIYNLGISYLEPALSSMEDVKKQSYL